MKKILIVDDYPDILEGLSYALKDHYKVTTAGNLTEAKKEVSTTAFDVICSDYAMPDGTGLDLQTGKVFYAIYSYVCYAGRTYCYRSKIVWCRIYGKTDSDLISFLRENAN